MPNPFELSEDQYESLLGEKREVEFEYITTINDDHRIETATEKRLMYVVNDKNKCKALIDLYNKCTHDKRGTIKNVHFHKNIEFTISNCPPLHLIRCKIDGRTSGLHMHVISECNINIVIQENRAPSPSVINNSIINKLTIVSPATVGTTCIGNSLIRVLHNNTSISADNSHIQTLEGCNKLSAQESFFYMFKPASAVYCVLEDCTIHSANFVDSKFQSKAIFIGNTFKTPIEQYDAKFSSNNVSFQDNTFEDINSNEALGSFRSLKKMCQDSEYEHGVILFHAYELQTYFNVFLKGQLWSKDFPEYISSVLHKTFTDYGKNTFRPILWLAIIFIICGFFYYTMTFDDFFTALKYTNKNMLGPAAYALPKDYFTPEETSKFSDLMHTIGFFQIIFSSLLWFLVIMMIRRRFKI